MLPVLVCAEGFLLSHTSEVVDVPDQETVDAFLPEFRPPDDWVLDPDVPRAFSALPEPNDYAAFQRNVADAMDDARARDRRRSRRSSPSHFGREKVGALEIAGNPDADTALVTIGTIGDTAQELLGRRRRPPDRPRPRLPAVPGGGAGRRARREPPHVSVVDRASAFGSFGPLGSDVEIARSRTRAGRHELRLRARRDGGHARPRCAGRSTQTRSAAAGTSGLAPVYVPEGV